MSYIKPQQQRRCKFRVKCCISLMSYIKPQRCTSEQLHTRVVYRLCPTSNHNSNGATGRSQGLYIAYVLHQTTTVRNPRNNEVVVYRLCPTSNHNELGNKVSDTFVVYRLCPTSNHNLSTISLTVFWLYIAYVLHQTTTERNYQGTMAGCISLMSYIKPQPRELTRLAEEVVYRLCPTSNHNSCQNNSWGNYVVYRLCPTSNHNATLVDQRAEVVVYRLCPTSNHNRNLCAPLM